MQKNHTKQKSLTVKAFRNWFFPVLIPLSLFLLLIYSETAVNYMRKGLTLCATAVIPSLFPFMIISELIIKSGIGQIISRIFRLPMKLIFVVNESAASAFILGALCGFPIGTLTLVKMLDRGEISKRELERMMTFCNIPGAAFVISTVGASLLGSLKLGILIFFSIVVSSLIIGIFCRFIYRKDDYRNRTSPPINIKITVNDFTDSVRSSATSILNVCAFILFFSTVVGCIGSIIKGVGISETALAFICGIFEISGGVSAAAALSIREQAAPLCAFIAGWSGISVHFQLMSLASGRNISFKPYIIAKTAQGVLAALITFSVTKTFPDLLASSSTVFLPNFDCKMNAYTMLSLAFFLASAAFLSFKEPKETKTQNIIKNF